MNTVQQWINWLETAKRSVIKLGLVHTTKIAEKLNLIQWECPVITVAGTNGKGTCANSLSVILQKANKSVGLYTSPHLLNFNERIKFNHEVISDAELIQAFTQVHAKDPQQLLTYFEFTTLAALVYFKQKKPDFLVLEVGIGGRLDAVNVVQNDYSIITSIGLEHTDFLGDTLEQIAFEKAGIIKRGNVVICGEIQPIDVIRRQCQQKQATLYTLSHQTKLPEIEANNKSTSFFYSKSEEKWHWHNGSNQKITNISYGGLLAENLAIVLQACSLIPGIKLSKKQLLTLLGDLTVPGRFQQVMVGKQQFILDVAHNPPAAFELSKQIIRSFPNKRIHIIFGMLANKNYKKVIEIFHDIASNWYLCDQIRNEYRAGIPSAELSNSLRVIGTKYIEVCQNMQDAVSLARKQATYGDIILILGSFSLVANGLEVINKIRTENLMVTS